MSTGPEKSMPPVEHRFPPGKSGNPSGRPKGSKNKKPKMRKAALDETVKLPMPDGVVRRMTRREALIRYAQSRAVKAKDAKLSRLLLRLDLILREWESKIDYTQKSHSIRRVRSNALTNIEAMLRALGLGKLIYPDKPAMRVALHPRLVTLALARFGDRRLTRDEQMLVVWATLTPWKVPWPDWWDEDLRKGKHRLPKRLVPRYDLPKELDGVFTGVLGQPRSTEEPVPVFSALVRGDD